MPQRFRDFGSTNVFDTDGLEPVLFRLDGETFRCRPALPGAMLLQFVADADSGDGGRASGAIPRLFKLAMEPTEYEWFQQFVNRPTRIIDLNTLAEIAGWLVEMYTDRPTQPSVPSSTGTSTIAPTLVDRPSSEVLF